MVEAWNNSGWGERIGAIAMTLLALVFGIFMVWATITGRFKFTSSWVSPNTLPSNIQHSPIAAEKVAECELASSPYSSKGRDTFYANAMIECLYAAGFTLEYNGEPVRRELTPND